MRIALKFADSLNFKRVGKASVLRDFRLSLAKRPEKLLVKTRPTKWRIMNVPRETSTVYDNLYLNIKSKYNVNSWQQKIPRGLHTPAHVTLA